MRKARGRMTMVRARATRCASPPERVAGRLPSRGATRTVSATASTRARTSAGGVFLIRRGKAMLSKTLMCGKSARLWKTMPSCRSRGSRSVTRSPPM